MRFLTLSDQMKFDSQVFSKYEVSDHFESFVFKDIYLDSSDFKIKKAKSAYRLRYRWVRQEKYYRHRLFPFLKVFYPDRCEIQFKGGYERNQNDGTIGVLETRFEFRNASEPFIKDKSAPKSPWKPKTFLNYAQSGMYLNYPMLPFQKLLERLPKKNKSIEIKPVIEVVTERYRTHLYIKNPWGVGPNPEQAFIITIDVAKASEFKASKLKAGQTSKKRFLEIEIETDRNISTEVDRMAKMPVRPNSLEVSAKDFSTQAKENLLYDLKVIESSISKILIKDYSFKRLPVTNKYSRLVEPYIK